jgi:hypothetical protein
MRAWRTSWPCAWPASIPADVGRFALAHRLRAIFSPAQGDELEELLRSCDDAARDHAGAREAYTRALELGVDPEAVRGWMRLVDQAGRGAEAATLYAVALRVPEVRADIGCATQALETLPRYQRLRFASDVAKPWVYRATPATPEFFVSTCQILFATGRWPELWDAAMRLSEVGDGVKEGPMVFFFRDIAWMRQPAKRPAILPVARLELIMKFLNTAAAEPVPGARALAYRECAGASRELGEAQAEREQLTGALELEPDGDGELWLRLAELQLNSAHSGYRDPEVRFAKGLRLLPARTAELMPRWKELGELELRAAGMDPYTLRTQDRQRRTWVPPGQASPYELYRMAQVHLEGGDPVRARQYVKKLLQDLPGFLPAIDLALDIARQDGSPRELVELCVQRVAVQGADARVIEILAGLPETAFEPEERVALMRGDPEHLGRVSVARTLERRGQPERALALLEGPQLASASRDVRSFAARLAYQLEGAPRALEILDGLGSEPSTAPELEIYVRAALRAKDAVRLDAGLQRLLALPTTDAQPLLALADQLLLENQVGYARGLLETLDGQPQLRSGELVRRLLACALVQRDELATRLYDARTQAFETQGAYELCTLLAAVDQERWEDVAPAANALLQSRLRAAPLQRACLALLAEDAGGAREQLEAAPRDETRSPVWDLLDGAAASRAGASWTPAPTLGASAAEETELFLHGAQREADLRQALALVLASNLPAGQGWARARLEELPKRTRGSLWRNWLLAGLARDAQDVGHERELLHALLARHAQFVAGWDAYEGLPLPPGAASSVRLLTRERRTQALGALAGNAIERALLEVARQEAAGDAAAALAAARRAVEFAPRSGRARRELALCLEDAGQLAEALVEGQQALVMLAARVDDEFLGRHLALIARTAQLDPPPLAPELLAEHLASLRAQHPNDPRVIAALARRDLAGEPRNPSIGVARALARLDGFRARHAGRTLESLAPGGLASWMELELELDPARAGELARAERLLEPGDPLAWLQCARALAAQGERAAALAELRVVDQLQPRSGLPREILRWSVRGELKLDQLGKLIADVQASEGLAEPDAELRLLRAENAWINGPRTSGVVIDTLSAPAAAFPSGPAFTELAQRRALLLAAALCTRAGEADRAQAKELLATLRPGLRDVYTRDLARALGGLCAVPGTEPAAPATAGTER